MSNAANYDEGDSRTELVERLGAVVADADAYTYRWGQGSAQRRAG